MSQPARTALTVPLGPAEAPESDASWTVGSIRFTAASRHERSRRGSTRRGTHAAPEDLSAITGQLRTTQRNPTPDGLGIAATLMAADQWATILTPPVMSVLAALISVTWGEQRAEVILSPDDIRHLLHPDVLPFAEGCIAVLVAHNLVRRRPAGGDEAYALSWRRLVAGGDAAVQKRQGVSRHD